MAIEPRDVDWLVLETNLGTGALIDDEISSTRMNEEVVIFPLSH